MGCGGSKPPGGSGQGGKWPEDCSGIQYYKSGWLKKKGKGFGAGWAKRWFQLRHYCVYYYPDEQSGWNSEPSGHNMGHDWKKCNSGNDCDYNGGYSCDGCGSTSTPWMHCDTCDLRDEGDDFFCNGEWVGHWYQGASQGEMKVEFTMEGGSVSGKGSDSVGEFEIDGKYDEGDKTIEFVKAYVGKHSVTYKGKRSEEWKWWLEGTWTMDGSEGKWDFERPSGKLFDYCMRCFEKWSGPEEEPDDDWDFEMPKLKFPPLPSFKMPDISMPDVSMPDVSMPDVSMPDVSMPDLSAPDLSAPDLSAPDLSMPKKKERREGGPYGRIQMCDAKTSFSGKKVYLKNADQVRIFKNENEDKKNQDFVLEAETEEEAVSWCNSFIYGGAEYDP